MSNHTYAMRCARSHRTSTHTRTDAHARMHLSIYIWLLYLGEHDASCLHARSIIGLKCTNAYVECVADDITLPIWLRYPLLRCNLHQGSFDTTLDAQTPWQFRLPWHHVQVEPDFSTSQNHSRLGSLPYNITSMPKQTIPILYQTKSFDILVSTICCHALLVFPSKPGRRKENAGCINGTTRASTVLSILDNKIASDVPSSTREKKNFPSMRGANWKLWQPIIIQMPSCPL